VTLESQPVRERVGYRGLVVDDQDANAVSPRRDLLALVA
jgi:hypothetical protein